MEDYDDLRISDYSVNISNSEQLFDLIGKERYYPQSILGRVKLEKGKIYRIVIFDKSIGKEKVFRLPYNPSFNFRINHLLRKS